VRDLRKDVLAGLVERYCDELELPADERRRVVGAVLERQRRIVHDFEALRRSLRGERRELAGRGPRRPLGSRIAARLQDAWQRFVVLVLHDRVVRPGLLAYRWLLARLRGSGSGSGRS
jgi:hypothetical protein